MSEASRESQTLATHLLESYEAGSSFFFASPRRTMLARGMFSTVPSLGGARGLADLPERVGVALAAAREAGHDIPVAVGAVPFDGSVPAQLTVPLTLQRRRAPPPSCALRARACRPRRWAAHLPRDGAAAL